MRYEQGVSLIVLGMSIILFWNVLFYKELRRKYKSRFYHLRSSMHTFVELMSYGSKCVLRKLAAYIFHVFKIRDDIDGE